MDLMIMASTNTDEIARELAGRLSLKLDFTGWSYSGAENRLEVALCFDDQPLTTESVSIDPAGYVRERSDY